jgi:hypothetical protein
MARHPAIPLDDKRIYFADGHRGPITRGELRKIVLAGVDHWLTISKFNVVTGMLEKTNCPYCAAGVRHPNDPAPSIMPKGSGRHH